MPSHVMSSEPSCRKLVIVYNLLSLYPFLNALPPTPVVLMVNIAPNATAPFSAR
jgi:hypothetical protein